ncbi:hypothetical protein QUF76_04605 [Desulfobacterales bacterium HSG16]|nr:hypothetical protein [Desulfobacterales bacterium HSG16]
MENIQGKLEKKVGVKKMAKTPKRETGWTLLYVADDGTIKDVRWYVGLLKSAFFFLFIFGIAIVWLSFLYYAEKKEKLELARNLNGMTQKTLQSGQGKEFDDKTILVAQNADDAKNSVRVNIKKEKSIAGTKTIRTANEVSGNDISDDKVPEKKASRKKTASAVEVKTLPEITDTVSRSETKKEPELKNTKKEKIPKKKTKQEKSAFKRISASVDIRNFDASYRKKNRLLKLKFKVRNTKPRSGRISGHVIMVLKTGSKNRKQWKVLPRVKLVKGLPSGKQKGVSFNISKFKPLNFDVKRIRKPNFFKKATIYIFANSGELMLEKTFPILFN